MYEELNMTEPIKKSVKAKGHTPQYRMHKYFARRPYNVFSNLIEHYSKKGDIILDCFCGGGVTIFEALALDRKVVGVDINPLATFITEMQIQQVDTDALSQYFENFLEECKQEFSNLYDYNIMGEKITPKWIEWTYEVKCPECSAIIRLTEDNKITNGKYKCPNSKCPTNSTAKPGVMRTKCEPYRSIPLRNKYINQNNEISMHEYDDNEKQDLLTEQRKLSVPDNMKKVDFAIPHNWDRWYEDCLPQKGVNNFSDLFSQRNYYINTVIFNKILNLPEGPERDLLYFAFSSSLRYTNKMSRVTKNWENGNPTCMDKHAYWLPNIYVECNVLDKLEDRMKAVIKGLSFTNKKLTSKKNKGNCFEDLNNGSDYLILTQSSSNLPIPDESVDAVITDPPYGSNVQYGELSSFWNIWYKEYKGLDNFIYNDEEAVANRKSCFENAKDVNFYGDMLKKVYTEAGRVLKPEGYLVFTFNNKNINVWVQLLKAVVEAGFYLPENGVIYQDFIKSYKNTSHLKYSGNIHGDFIYSFQKGSLPEYDMPIGNFEETVQLEVVKCLRNMYQLESDYSTTELYEKIYSSLINVIMRFIYKDEYEDLEKIEELSKSYIDNLLNQNLKMIDGRWFVKEGVNFVK